MNMCQSMLHEVLWLVLKPPLHALNSFWSAGILQLCSHIVSILCVLN